MTATKLAIVSVTLVALLLAVPLEAQAMRCGNRLVSRDDSRGRVAALCGNPDDISSRTIYQTSGHYRHDVYSRRGRYIVRHGLRGPQIEIPIQIEQWTYNFGRNRLMRQVTFADGRVERIDSLGYGYDARPLPQTHPRRSNDSWLPRPNGQQDDWVDNAAAPAPEQRAHPQSPHDDQPWRQVRVEAAPKYTN